MTNLIFDFVNSIRSRLFYKMLIIYSLLTLVPLIVVSTTFYYRSSQLIGKKAAEDAQQELAAAASAIDAPLLAIKKRMLEIGERDTIQSYLRLYRQTDANATNDENRFNLLESVKDVLQVERNELKRTIGPFVDSMYLITPDDRVVGIDGSRTLQYPSAYRLLPFEFDRMPEWAFFTDARRMACDMNIYGIGNTADTDQLLGRLVVTLLPSSLQNVYADFAPGTFYITSSDNIILSASDPDEIGSVLDVRGPATQLLIRQKSQYADYRYIRLATPGTDKIVKKQALFSATLTFLAWLAVLVVTYLILRRVTDPIQRLTRLMRRAENEEYQLFQDVATRDEIAMLCHGYNRLVLRTKDLIDKNYKNELLVREAELKAIRMYINPHFLYNTLEYISIMSQNPDKARYVPDIVQKLSSIFRFSIIPGEKFVPLETEFAFAEKYLQIHQYRFGGRMQHAIVLPEMLRQAVVPKLVLQPLVENAVIHGIDRLPDGGRIEIEAKEEEYMLAIEVRNPAPPVGSDRGSGPGRPGKKGLGSGLENVNMRIRHHFGNVYGAKLGRDAEGTVTVTLKMPIQLWNQTGEE
ncbi:sensor histidine kinase [Cohnella zeiphila]|uniref:Sensor histidine kinase n=1 Tax=Cohnella zeiphila TaxID=2761120 RepID=A0A7X0VXQ1_9BACL|nr:histidine kinase [Cohnella zeiphila]MBB6732158.1 sensor histidine kinase [Cohnella zeiphila]